MKRVTSISTRGFTLIELLLVIGILAGLATVVILILNPTEMLQAYLFGDILSRHRIVARYHHYPDPRVVAFLHGQRDALAYRVGQAQEAYKFKIEIVL